LKNDGTMKLKRLITITLLIFLLVFGSRIMAQCCSAGNPPGNDGDQSSIGKKNLMITVAYKYGFANKYYTGDSPITLPEMGSVVKEASYNYLESRVSYGINSKMSVLAEIGYFIGKKEKYTSESWETQKGYGLADASLLFRYRIYHNWKKQFEISPFVGIKIPVGVFDQEVNHVQLPITLQPSSGSYRYLASVYVSKGFPGKNYHISSLSSIEIAQRIKSDNFDYTYGTLYSFSVTGSYKFFRFLTTVLQLRNENRAKAHRDGNQIVESSGYSIVYLAPQMQFVPIKNWKLSVSCDLPVYKHYNGIQLSNGYACSFRLVHQLNFN